MKFLLSFGVLISTFFSTQTWIIQTPITKSGNSLILVHVLFRHGNRTANGPEELYPKDPYLNMTYFPTGLGQLTNVGKEREFSIGVALRDRYNSFLGPYYYPEIVDARSTDFNRTKMSLQLVLAGLFPPRGREIWKSLMRWQPVPYNYYPASQDQVLLGTGCPNYKSEYEAYKNSPTVQAEFDKDRTTFEYLTQNTGKNITSFQDVYNLYFGMSTEEEYGLQLPQWTKLVWPQKVTELAIKEYYITVGTQKLRQIAVGYFLDKLIRDTEAKIASNKEHDRKMYLYSAHELNVAQFLLTLGIFDPPQIPNYGAYVTVEVHKMPDSKHGFKILYENYTKRKPQVLTLPGCEEICEIEKFKGLVKDSLPINEDMCGNKKCQI